MKLTKSSKGFEIVKNSHFSYNYKETYFSLKYDLYIEEEIAFYIF